MPAKSEKQRKLMGAALAYKRGESENASDEVKRIANEMTEKELEDFASKPQSEKRVSKRGSNQFRITKPTDPQK